MSKKTSEKIDEMLGIPSGIDDFLNDLSVDDVQQSFSDIDENVKNEIQNLDTQISAFQIGDISNLNFKSVEESFSNIKGLIEDSKSLLKHIHSCLVTTDLLDSEAIDSFSHLLEAAHITIAEYINLYKNRLGFYDKIKLMFLKQQQDLEKMKIKHQYDLELLEKRNKDNVIDVEEGAGQFSFEKAIKAINFDDDISLEN